MELLGGLELPVLAAPMAGGPSTADLVAAAAGCGGLGFVPAGYLTPEGFSDALAAVRRRTPTYAANLFVPEPMPVDRTEYADYRRRLAPLAARAGVPELPEVPREDDDRWREKVEVLLADPPPLVSFTFGIPDATALAALRRAGSVLAQTVTTPEEARRAEAAGVDLLMVQAAGAGGHSGTLDPRRPISEIALPDLLARVRAASTLPMVGAGGVADARDVGSALRAGAEAVAIGTLLLRADEAGTNPVHRAALAAADAETVLTHAFTGRPARGLRNAFIDAFEAVAPYGYPALHHLTAPLRRAGVAAGDPENVHLWAGTGHGAAREAPAADILRELAA
jgi:nitronate monooxygenase